MIRRLLIILLVVLALSVISLFLPAQRVTIDSIGRLSLETSITLSVGQQVVYASPDAVTNSPSANSGGWTNPTYAYADDANYASITSGTPSASHTYSGYGFSLAGNRIDQVRVRYDAWYAVSATSQTRRPTGDSDVSGTWTLTPTDTLRYEKVDETPASDSDYITLTTTGGYSYFSFSNFSVPSGSTISNLTIYYRAKDAISYSITNVGAAVKVGGTLYGRTDTDPWSFFWSYSYSFTTNPKTGAAWTVDDINGTGANPLQAFGINSTDSDPNISISQCYAVVNYTPYDGEQIRVDVSWDGGFSWSSKQATDLTSAQATYWYDVTGATAWNASKLSDTYFRVRVDAYTVGTASQVRLDWIPVEVNYTPPSISNTPSEKAFGVVAENSSYWSKGDAIPPTFPLDDGECYFTVTNNGSGAVNITIRATDFSGGVGWTLASSPGENIVTLKAGRSGDLDEGAMVTLTTSNQSFIDGLAASQSKMWEIKLETGTFTDGADKTSTITLTAAYP